MLSIDEVTTGEVKQGGGNRTQWGFCSIESNADYYATDESQAAFPKVLFMRPQKNWRYVHFLRFPGKYLY